MALAEQIGGEILSVDSMQLYRGMDIGTAKPTAQEQRRVPHHLIDLASPNEDFTVARFVQTAEEAIRNTQAPLIATGGTPMFYKALFEGIFEGPAADMELRSRLQAVPADELHSRLRSVDPAAAGRIHANDTRRVVRALEVYELTGRPITSFQSQWGETTSRHAARWFGLMWDKESLNRRINQRVREMIAAGWVEEVRRLLEQYTTLSKTAGEATGYAELIDHLQGRGSLEDAVEQIKIGTRQLARRQMKWFRRFPNVTWIEGDQPVETIAKRIAGEVL
jgi:tRNA dimethylallyltransferase